MCDLIALIVTGRPHDPHWILAHDAVEMDKQIVATALSVIGWCCSTIWTTAGGLEFGNSIQLDAPRTGVECSGKREMTLGP